MSATEKAEELLREWLEEGDPHGDLAYPITLEGIRFSSEAVIAFAAWLIEPTEADVRGL